MPIHSASSSRHSQPDPVGRLVARAPVTFGFDESLQQYRRVPIPLLPVSADPRRYPRQRRAGQIPNTHPRKDQKARVRHHPVQPLCAVPLAPADPFIPLRQRPCRRCKQQTTQPPPRSVHNEVPLMRSKRALVPQSVIPLDVFVPQPDRFSAQHRRHLHRFQLPHRSRHLLFPVRSSAYFNTLFFPCRAALPGWQFQKPLRFHLPQRLRAGVCFVPPRWCNPPQVLTHRLHQLRPTQTATFDRLLNVLDFLSREISPRKKSL